MIDMSAEAISIHVIRNEKSPLNPTPCLLGDEKEINCGFLFLYICIQFDIPRDNNTVVVC